MKLKLQYMMLIVTLLCSNENSVQLSDKQLFLLESHSMSLHAISLEETLQRFYILQRIEPFIHVIAEIKSDFWAFPIPLFDYDKVHYDGVLFINEHILALIDAVKKDRSIMPILHMWSEIKRYKYLHDQEMIREFIQLIFIVTRYSLNHQAFMNNETEVPIKNIYIIDALETLSLDQILDILDILAEDLPVFIQKYELNSSMTWKQWLDKYWLVAPLAIVALLAKIVTDYSALQTASSNQSLS